MKVSEEQKPVTTYNFELELCSKKLKPADYKRFEFDKYNIISYPSNGLTASVHYSNYELIYSGGSFNLGCQRFTKDDLQSILNVLNGVKMVHKTGLQLKIATNYKQNPKKRTEVKIIDESENYFISYGLKAYSKELYEKAEWDQENRTAKLISSTYLGYATWHVREYPTRFKEDQTKELIEIIEMCLGVITLHEKLIENKKQEEYGNV